MSASPGWTGICSLPVSIVPVGQKLSLCSWEGVFLCVKVLYFCLDLLMSFYCVQMYVGKVASRCNGIIGLGIMGNSFVNN